MCIERNCFIYLKNCHSSLGNYKRETPNEIGGPNKAKYAAPALTFLVVRTVATARAANRVLVLGGYSTHARSTALVHAAAAAAVAHGGEETEASDDVG